MSRDWSLVCEREGMKATVGAAPMAGYLVGKVFIRTHDKRHITKITSCKDKAKYFGEKSFFDSNLVFFFHWWLRPKSLLAASGEGDYHSFNYFSLFCILY